MMTTISRTTSFGKTALTNDDLRRSVPSVFAATPWERMSHRYKFIPTIEVVDVLRDKGFSPSMAIQSRSRIEGKGAFTKHMIRFRATESFGPLVVGAELPELVLVNSHDGTSGYQLMSGIYRVLCANGMVTHSADLDSVSVHHKGGSDFHQKIIDATYEVMDSAPKTMAQIQEWKQIALPAPARTIFAEAVKELVPEKPIEANRLLSARRSEDRATDLWTTVNVAQENLIRGGLRGMTPTGKRSTTREVKGVSENLRLNKALWMLADRMAQLVG